VDPTVLRPVLGKKGGGNKDHCNSAKSGSGKEWDRVCHVGIVPAYRRNSE